MNKYFGRFHNDVTVDGLRDFIANQNVTVETKHNCLKSFCLRVKRVDLTKLEDTEFWPEGVIFSSFFRSPVEDHQGADAKINDNAGQG